MTKNKVLILLDGSEFRARILPAVRQFLRPEDNHLILLRVAPPPQTVYHSTHHIEGVIFVSVHDERLEADISTQMRDELMETKQMLEAAGYVVNRQVRFGSAAEEIERAIVANQIDLVAMTTHARSGLSKLLYGSIAEHLLHHAKVPILLLHPAE